MKLALQLSHLAPATLLALIGLTPGHAQGPTMTVPQVENVPAAATQAAATIDAEKIRAHVKFLSSDLLEGRGPGKRGAELAAEYIATQFALDGLKPAGDHGTFYQNVPLYAVHTDEAKPPHRLCPAKDSRSSSPMALTT